MTDTNKWLETRREELAKEIYGMGYDYICGVRQRIINDRVRIELSEKLVGG